LALFLLYNTRGPDPTFSPLFGGCTNEETPQNMQVFLPLGSGLAGLVGFRRKFRKR